MRIILLRHGKTEANIKQLIDENPLKSTSLVAEGREQAKRAAEKLKNIPIDIIYVSELVRTQETAAIINEGRNIPVLIDARINEFRSGLNGHAWPDVEQQFNESDDGWNLRVNDGETMNEEYDRVIAFIEYIKTKPDQNVLVISHGDPLMMMDGYLKRVEKINLFDQSYITNCEIRTHEVKK